MNAMNEKISAIPKSLSKRPSRDMAIMNYVGAPDKNSGKYHQNNHIQYDLIGFIPLDVLTREI